METQQVLKYLQRKIECFNLKKIKEKGLALKLVLCEKMFNIFMPYLENVKRNNNGDITMGEYEEIIIWNRDTEKESALFFIDAIDGKIQDELAPYI